MFEIFKVKPDYTNLTGVLYIVGQQITNYDPKPKHPIFFQRTEMVRTEHDKYQKAKNHLDKKFGKHLDKADIEDVLKSAEGLLDGYDLGLVRSLDDWQRRVSIVSDSYRLEYYRQLSVPELKFFEMTADERYRVIKKLFKNMSKAAYQRNDFGQLMAKKTLLDFLPDEKFKPPLEDLNMLAGSKRADCQKLVENRIEVIQSIAADNITKILALQKDYERIAPRIT
jgi:hypothetical protein